jgi:hypothetical protein
MVELEDGRLELAVEDNAIGDDDHLVEDLSVFGVEPREPVGEPGDRVRLAGARRVLNQVVPPRAAAAGVSDEPAYGVPLLEAREDQLAAGRLLAAPGTACRRRRLDMDEAVEELKP